MRRSASFVTMKISAHRDSITTQKNQSVIRSAAEALKKGSLVIIPTDTVYGIAAYPGAPGAEDRLYDVKGREKSKPIPLLASDLKAAEEYGVSFGELDLELAERFWPGPLTLVLAVRAGISGRSGRPRLGRPGGSASGGSVRFEGVRVPDCEVTRALLREAGGLLRVTSANRSGEAPARNAEEAASALGLFVDMVIDAGPARGGTPSTVVKVGKRSESGGHGCGYTEAREVVGVGHSEIRILRKGAIGVNEILKVFGDRAATPQSRGPRQDE